MDPGIFKRTTFVVADAERSAKFFCDVFGWTIWYDNTLTADHRFPPTGSGIDADVRLVILQASDPTIGKLGLLQYLDPPFETALPEARNTVRLGDPVLVIEAEDIDAMYERAVAAGARVVTPPVDWSVPAADGQTRIALRSVSLFDENGIYMEVSAHPGRGESA